MRTPSQSDQLNSMLRQLQRDVELSGDGATRSRRRLTLKGMRLACWCFDNSLPLRKLERELRYELFGDGTLSPPTEGNEGNDD